MSNLRSMTQDEFLAFALVAVPSFAAEKVASGQWKEADALELSRKSFAELLPQGLATSDNHFFTVRDQTAQINVGIVWIAAQDRAGKRIAYVYEISIKPEHQRRGHAKRAFLALEDKVRALGLSGIALHVFGHNTAAQALYLQLGYQPTNINLFKAI